jgi:hypothetical protein
MEKIKVTTTKLYYFEVLDQDITITWMEGSDDILMTIKNGLVIINTIRLPIKNIGRILEILLALSKILEETKNETTD